MHRHEVDLTSLTFGLVFTAIALAGLLNTRVDARWILPAVLAVLGVIGLAATVRAARTGRVPTATTETTGTDDDEPAA